MSGARHEDLTRLENSLSMCMPLAARRGGRPRGRLAGIESRLVLLPVIATCFRARAIFRTWLERPRLGSDGR